MKVRVTYRLYGASFSRDYSSRYNAKRGIQRLRLAHGRAIESYWLMEVTT